MLTASQQAGKQRNEARLKIIYKNSVRTAKKTPHFTITETNFLTLFKEMTAVYTYTVSNRDMK
jgi:hypothetical protein